MMYFYNVFKYKGLPVAMVLGFLAIFCTSIRAQVSSSNSRPTIDPIEDHTTSYSADTRYIEINGITPGEEIDQEVSISVSTGDKDLIESISADMVDNGKAFINYRLKKGAAGTAKIKVIVTDNGQSPASYTRTFHILIESLNRDLPVEPKLETEANNLKAVPNPAYVSTRIFFSTPHDEQQVAVDLYTLSGAKIRQLFNGSTLARQQYYVDVNSRNLAAGAYIVRLTGQTNSSNLKLVVAK